VDFSADVQGADTFKWTVRDASGKSASAGTSQALINFPLKTEGTFAFSLEAVQKRTGAAASSNVVTLTIKQAEEKPPVEPGCGSLAALVEGFAKLPAVDKEQFPAFGKILEELGLNAFFAELARIATLPPASQLEFFDKAPAGGKPFADNMLVWMDRLAALIADDKKIALRALALETYRLLTELTLYVSCIREKDLGSDEERIFANMVAQLKGRGKKGILARAATAEKGKLSALRRTLEAELKRRDKNRDRLMKPKYDDALNAVLKLFKT
jgi:hypothetical protein